MKLYHLTPDEHYGPPCGCVALSILNGLKPLTNLKNIIKFRNTQKIYRDEYIFDRKKFYFDRTVMYFAEILHFFSPFFHKKSKMVWVKKNISLFEFCELLNPKHYYLIASTQHLQIVKNERIWDTDGINCPIYSNQFNQEKVKWFVRLK